MSSNNNNGKGNNSSTVGVVVAVVAFAAWGISKLMGDSGESNNKMMKKPGADGYMRRSEFEESPSTYFRDLRGKK